MFTVAILSHCKMVISIRGPEMKKSPMLIFTKQFKRDEIIDKFSEHLFSVKKPAIIFFDLNVSKMLCGFWKVGKKVLNGGALLSYKTAAITSLGQ